MPDWTTSMNSVADAWTSWMLHMSWQVALLVLAVWLVCRIFHYTAAQFRHALWLIIFIKLILPPSLATPWSAGTLYTHATNKQVSVQLVSAPLPAEDDSTVGAQPVTRENTLLASSPNPMPILEQRPPVNVPPAQLSANALIMIAWAIISLTLVGALLVQYTRFVRRLIRGASLVSDAIQASINEHASAMNIAKPVLGMISPAVATPAVFGVRRPILLLPEKCEQTFSAQELDNIVAHELAHVRRGDLVVTILAGVITCLYWFHPAVWIANLYQRREREMACDDLVLDKNRDAGKAYAATLLCVAEHFTGRVPAYAGFLGLIELSDSLLHRVLSATDAKRPRRFGWASTLVFTAVVAIAPMGVWTATAQNNPTPDPIATAVDQEIQANYARAAPEVQEYIRWTAKTFGNSKLWLPEDAFKDLSQDQREEKVKYYADALSGEYGRHQCEALAAAGVLKDKRLLPGVLKAATYHLDDRDYDCRPKWIAVEAVGRIGEESAVPSIIPLVDHGNQNTRMWARATLVRLTGQNFNDDKQAWGKWWNDSGKEPKIDLAQLKPWAPPTARTVQASTTAPLPAAVESPSTSNAPPEIVSVTPAIGARDVDPATTEIRVTFDQDMAGGFSWTGSGAVYPKTTGNPRWIDKRTCVLPVALEAANFYRVGINSKSHQNFKSEAGTPTRPRAIYFATKGAGDATLAKLTAPQVVALTPANGATNVAASTTTLTGTFNIPMGDGFSWTKAGGVMPEMTGKPVWNADHTACSAEVNLQPNTTYTLGLNHVWAVNFQSANGVPLEPVVWSFTTGSE